MKLLDALIDYLQAKFPPNRVVILLTPVFAAAAAFVAAWTAKHVPGLRLDQGQLTAIFVTGAASVIPLVYKWLDGWQKHEAQVRRTLYYTAGTLDPRDLPEPVTAVPVFGQPSEALAQEPDPREAELRAKGFPPPESADGGGI